VLEIHTVAGVMSKRVALFRVIVQANGCRVLKLDLFMVVETSLINHQKLQHSLGETITSNSETLL
jgi:hypothetical protein